MRIRTIISWVIMVSSLGAIASNPPAIAGSNKEAKNKVTYDRIGKILKGPKININTADEKALSNLKGVAPELARKIVDYRSKYGRFKNIEALKNVKSLDDKIFAQIASMIKVK